MVEHSTRNLTEGREFDPSIEAYIIFRNLFSVYTPYFTIWRDVEKWVVALCLALLVACLMTPWLVNKTHFLIFYLSSRLRLPLFLHFMLLL